MCTAIKCGTLKVGLSTVGAVGGVFLIGQGLTVLERGAWAPSGNRKLNRNIINAIGGQRLVVGGDFVPSAAVREINRALQTAKHSRSTLNWDEITRAIYGLYNSLPVNSAYIDGELDLAKAITEKNKMALRNPCDLLTMAHAGTIFHELSGFGTSFNIRNTQRTHAIERFAECSAAAEHGPPEERPDSLALAPRRSTAGRDQFGLVLQEAGADSAFYSYHYEHARFGGSGGAETDNAGRSGFGDAFFPDDSTWGYFPPHEVLASQSRGMSSCWNPSFSRMHNGT